MAEINTPFLMGFTDAVSTVFNERFGTTTPVYPQFCMDVKSMSRENVYPRFNDLPGFREWVGDRVLNSLSGTAYAIINKTFENTLEIKREDFEDDQYGLFTPVVAEMGQMSAELPDLLAHGLLASGDGKLGYDGVNFFGGGHLTSNAAQQPIAYNNLMQPTGGDAAGPAWYLMCTTRVMRPMIIQRRRPFVLTPRMNLSDPSVFDRGTFLWGVDGRMNAGYGMWQLVIKSYSPLTPAYYAQARTLMMSQRRADGTPFGIRPNILLHPPSLKSQAQTLLKIGVIGPQLNPNPWVNTAEPVESEWLS